MAVAEVTPDIKVSGSKTIDQMMKELLERFDFEYDIAVPLSSMFSAKYQRRLTSLAKEIAENYLPPLIGVILLSERTGADDSPFGRHGEPYAIVDGQTRVNGAANRLIDGEVMPIETLPCLIYKGLTKKDEAAIFSLLQRKRRNMTTTDRFDAAIEAEESEALGIRRVLRRHKVHVGQKSAKNSIQCVAELEATYRYTSVTKGYPNEGDLLDATIKVINEAWRPEDGDADPDLYTGSIVRGVAKVLSSSADINSDKLISRLRRTAPSKIAMQAGGLRMGNNGQGTVPTYVVQVILGEYSKKK